MDEYIFQYVKQLSNGTWEVYFFEDINCYSMNSSFLIKILSEIQSQGGTEVNILFNSQGGDAYEGIAIYNLLRNSTLKITGTIVGMAASAAGVAYMGCATRVMYPNSLLMIHRVSGYTSGNADELRDAADEGEKIEQQTKDIFARSSGQTPETVDTWFDGKNHWFNGTEAKALNLCDLVSEATTDTPQPVATTTQALQNMALPAIWQNYYRQYQSKQYKTMFRNTLIKLLQLAEDASEAQIEAAVKAATEASSDTQALADLKTKLDAAEAELKSFKDAAAAAAKAETEAATTAIEQAFSQKRITEGQKTAFMNVVKSSPKDAMQLLSTVATEPKKLKNELNPVPEQDNAKLPLAQRMRNYYEERNKDAQ